MITTTLLVALLASFSGAQLPTIPPVTLPAGVLPTGITDVAGIATITSDVTVAATATLTLPLTVGAGATLTVAAGQTLETAALLTLEAGSKIVLGANAAIKAANAALMTGVATIEGKLEVTGEAVVSANAELKVQGMASEIAGTVNAEANAKVSFAGNCAVSSATKFKGEGEFIVNGVLTSTGDAAVSLGETGKSKIQLMAGAAVAAKDSTKESAKVTIDATATVGAKTGDMAVEVRQGAVVAFEQGAEFAAEAVIDVKADGEVMLKSAGNKVASGAAKIEGMGKVVVDTAAEVNVMADASLDIAAAQSEIKGTVNAAAATSKVMLHGETTVSSATTLKGEGEFQLMGTVKTSGEAAVELGETGKGVVMLGADAVIMAEDKTKASATVVVNSPAKIGAASADKKTQVKGGAKVALASGCEFAGDSALAIEAESEVHIKAATSVVKAGTTKVSGSGKMLIDTMAKVTVEANANLELESTVDLAVGATVEAAADAKVMIKGKCMSSKGGAATITGQGTVVVGSTSDVVVDMQSSLDVKAMAMIEAGAQVSVMSDSLVTLHSGSCQAMTGATAANIKLMGGALKVTSDFKFDGSNCAIEGDADSQVEFEVEENKKATITGKVVTASALRCTGKGALVVDGDAEIDASVQVEAGSMIEVMGNATTTSTVVLTGGDSTVKVGAGGMLRTAKTANVGAGATLQVEAGGQASVEQCACGTAASETSGNIKVMGAGSSLAVRSRLNLDASSCDVVVEAGASLVYGGEGTEADPSTGSSTSEVNEGTYEIAKLHAEGKAQLIASGDVTLNGDVELDADAHLVATAGAAVEVSKSVKLTGKAVLRSSGDKAMKCQSIAFAEGTRYSATLAATAAASADAALTVMGTAEFEGELELGAYSALSNGDVHVIAKYDMRVGEFATVTVAGSAAAGGKRKRNADDWTINYEDKQATATYNGEDMEAKTTPAPTPVGTVGDVTTAGDVTTVAAGTTTAGEDATTTDDSAATNTRISMLVAGAVAIAAVCC